jgi:hypothetical protein
MIIRIATLGCEARPSLGTSLDAGAEWEMNADSAQTKSAIASDLAAATPAAHEGVVDEAFDET